MRLNFNTKLTSFSVFYKKICSIGHFSIFFFFLQTEAILEDYIVKWFKNFQLKKISLRSFESIMNGVEVVVIKKKVEE